MLSLFLETKDSREVKVQLSDFLKRNKDGEFPKNTWLRSDTINIYVRKSKRVFTNEKDLVWCLDIGSIEISKSQRSKGCFSNILNFIETIALAYDIKYIFIENILNNSRLVSFFQRRGYKINETGTVDKFVVCLYTKFEDK